MSSSRSLTKILGSGTGSGVGAGSGVGVGSGFVSQRYGSTDPNPDRYQNVTDPQHCEKQRKSTKRCACVERTEEAARGGVAGDKVQAPEVDHEEDGVGPQHGEEVRALHPPEGGAPQLRHSHVQHQAHLQHIKSDKRIKEKEN